MVLEKKKKVWERAERVGSLEGVVDLTGGEESGVVQIGSAIVLANWGPWETPDYRLDDLEGEVA